MSQYKLVQNLIFKNVPEIQKMSPKNRKIFLKNYLRSIISEVVKRVTLPDPIEIKSKFIRESYWDKRRPKGHKKGNWKLDYHLWRMLYEAKLSLNLGIDQDMVPDVGNVTNYTDYSNFEKGYLENTVNLAINSTDSTTIVKSTQILKMDEKLEEKILCDKNYTMFVGIIDTAIRSPSISKLGQSDFYLYEKTDVENNKWTKLILDVNFHKDSFESKMSKWEQIRNIIDNEIQKSTYDDNFDIINKMKKLFYINLVF